MAQKAETKPTAQIYICMSGLKLMLCSGHYKHVNESKLKGIHTVSSMQSHF